MTPALAEQPSRTLDSPETAETQPQAVVCVGAHSALHWSFVPVN